MHSGALENPILSHQSKYWSLHNYRTIKNVSQQIYDFHSVLEYIQCILKFMQIHNKDLNCCY